ncbi:hypothetical protein [Thiorhodococcus drewsii]|uniref:hypothetical protein n=1 Tax=Thiorhodococcus drewsii TaxID=210408 RepID=UPI001112099D|nr:hypothetical protein [Thiorhodococcus drewsii]
MVTVVHQDDHPTVLQLVIKNIGTGLARDVHFFLSDLIPERAFGWGEEPRESSEIAPMKSGPLINGIPALAPGETRRIFWGQYGGLKNAIGEKKIYVTCKFKKGKKEMTPVVCPLDVDSFLGTDAASSPEARSATQLEKIAKEIEQISTGFRELKIKVVSMPQIDSDDNH